MKKISTEQIEEIRKDLLDWYAKEKRDLPWRNSTDPYAIWVSEVMLQQTQTIKVIEYFERFIDYFPKISDLASAPLDDVLKQWEGLGYYARARNLHKAATYLMENYNGVIPREFEQLKKIPGIGEYTAAAIASIAFGEERAVVDGNVVRVLSRVFLIQKSIKNKDVKSQISARAEVLLDKKHPGNFNQALMELGATYCSPKSPKCIFCPISAHCYAFKTLKNPAKLPVVGKKKAKPHYQVAVGLIWDEGLLFIDRRLEDGLLGGLWEFPGGKIQNGETKREAIKREIKEETDLEIEVGDFFMEINHAYTHFKVTIYAYHCLYKSGEPTITAATDWRWVKPNELKYYPFAAASKKIIAKLDSEFAEHPPRFKLSRD